MRGIRPLNKVLDSGATNYSPKVNLDTLLGALFKKQFGGELF